MKHKLRIPATAALISSATVSLCCFATLATPAIAAGEGNDRGSSQSLGDPSVPAGAAAETAPPPPLQNTRMATLDGSASRWSGQFNMTYLGSSLDHPFSELAPNPGHSVPPPVVTLSGTVSARYRVDEKTTAGLGSGITTETPFQGPKNTTAADPYVDVARTFHTSLIHDRLDLQLTSWTNHQYFVKYGYRQGATLSNESIHEFDSGLTAGLYLQASANTFAAGQYARSQQNLYTFAYEPIVEYRINKMFNLRTVVGIIDSKNRTDTDLRFQHPGVYQTFGVGTALSKSVYVYTFVKAYPYADAPITNQNTVWGLSTIVNLF